MCGIIGLIDFNNKFGKKNIINILQKALKSQSFRGPDNNSFWLHENNQVALAHNRLSIIDLSSNGNQPMTSNSGNFVISYNGEVYNYLSLKRELEKDVSFKGNSDTEVILEYISKFGLENSVKNMDGMFSLALWDEKKRSIYLARDKIGIKPIYWTLNNDFFFFCSDLRCLKTIPNFDPKINKTSLSQLLKYGYIRAPNSIFENVHKLKPGEILSVDIFRKKINYKYWDSKSLKNYSKFSGLSSHQIDSEIEKKITQSIKSSMISDVPTGAFLSGGIDSSLLVSIMNNHTKNLKTFSIGFNENKYNEAQHSKKIAKYLGTDHHELYLSDNDLLDVIPKLPEIYSEPFGDSSQIPTYLVSKMSKKYVKVVLSGDGADELFGGYNRYFYADKIRAMKRLVPKFLLTNISKLFLYFFQRYGLQFYERFNISRIPQLMDKLKKVFLILSEKDSFIYETLISTKHNSDKLIKDFTSSINLGLNDGLDCKNFFEFMQLEDMLHYLPDDILTKVDRASMFCSQEVRVPYLNKDVIESSWKLDQKFKEKKIILKRILNNYLPEDLFLRPKMGFGVPLGEWLTGKLHSWMHDTLDRKKIIEEGFYDYDEIFKIKENKINIINNKYLLWNVLTFQAWLDNFKKKTVNI